MRRRITGRLGGLLVGLVTLLAVVAAPASAAVRPTVIGAATAAEGEWPWTAQVRLADGPATTVCTGSLISPDAILTAGHCVTGADHAIASPGDVTVLLGSAAADAAPAVVRVIRHPDYTLANHRSDLAVLRLARPVTGVVPARAARPAEASFASPGDVRRVLGWGDPAGWLLGPPSRIGSALTPIVEQFECVRVLGDTGWYRPGSLCLGPGACDDDAGGPVVLESTPPVVLGVISFAGPDGCRLGPVVAMRVDAYATWIAASLAVGSPPALATAAPVLPLREDAGLLRVTGNGGTIATTLRVVYLDGRPAVAPRAVAPGDFDVTLAVPMRAASRVTVRAIAENARGMAVSRDVEVATGDVTAPAVTARPARVRVGRRVRLVAVVTDNAGPAVAWIDLRRDGRRVRGGEAGALAGTWRWSTRFRAADRRYRWTFCVRARDASGNEASACAPVRLLKAVAR